METPEGHKRWKKLDEKLSTNMEQIAEIL